MSVSPWGGKREPEEERGAGQAPIRGQGWSGAVLPPTPWKPCPLTGWTRRSGPTFFWPHLSLRRDWGPVLRLLGWRGRTAVPLSPGSCLGVAAAGPAPGGRREQALVLRRLRASTSLCEHRAQSPLSGVLTVPTGGLSHPYMAAGFCLPGPHPALAFSMALTLSSDRAAD